MKRANLRRKWLTIPKAGWSWGCGGTVIGALGGYTQFWSNSTADSATLIANGGTGGGQGGAILFKHQSTIGTSNQAFTAFIPAASAAQFSQAQQYEGRIVAVSGKITLFKGKPEIIVKWPSQITAQ